MAEPLQGLACGDADVGQEVTCHSHDALQLVWEALSHSFPDRRMQAGERRGLTDLALLRGGEQREGAGLG